MHFFGHCALLVFAIHYCCQMKLSFCEINCILFVGGGLVGEAVVLWPQADFKAGIVVIFLLAKCGQTLAAIKAQTSLFGCACKFAD